MQFSTLVVLTPHLNKRCSLRKIIKKYIISKIVGKLRQNEFVGWREVAEINRADIFYYWNGQQCCSALCCQMASKALFFSINSIQSIDFDCIVAIAILGNIVKISMLRLFILKLKVDENKQPFWYICTTIWMNQLD